MNTQSWTTREKRLFAALLVMSVILGATVIISGQHILFIYEQLSSDETIGGWGATVYWYKNGNFVYSEHNVITNAARTALRPYIGDTAGSPFKYVAVGTGSGGGAGSTQLQSQYSTRGSGTYATVGSYNFTITYEFLAGFFSGQTITEAALFDQASDGVMFNYQDFTGITLNSGDSLEVVFNVQVGS